MPEEQDHTFRALLFISLFTLGAILAALELFT
jgi:hypothetical protein